MELNKNIEELKNGLKRSSSEYMHSLIHELHEQSDFLLDLDLYNDDEAMKKLEMQLQELFRVFSIRMNCR